MLGQRGSITLSLIVLAAILAGVFVGVFTLMGSMFKQNTFNDAQTTARLLKEKISATIENDVNWERTIARNPSLACLRTAGNVCTSGTFVLYDQNDSELQSFTTDGEPCAPGSHGCVFNFTFRWQPRFDASMGNQSLMRAGEPFAYYPTVVYNAEFTIAQEALDATSANAEFGRLKSDNYALQNIERGRSGDALAAACASIGGRFHQVEERCEVSPSLMGPCNPAEYMSGIDANGNRICRSIENGLQSTCPNSSAILAINPDWSLLCGKF